MIKSITIALLLSIFFASLLCAEENDVMDQYNNYQENATLQNFEKSIQHYETLLEKDENNGMARILLSYLY
ncbi:MAG: hypothetical protein U9N34_04520, partial [Candidatus Cloacimonadota bacterium]|nr:hypothetical protein [Candidatus Cloacimonadota bacterium]